MAQLTVVAIGPNEESCETLKSAVQRTGLSEKIIRLTSPLGDEWLRDLDALNVGAVVVHVPRNNASGALEAIARIHEYLAGARVIAVGEATDSIAIVEAMRAGASDFLEYPPQATELARALLHKAAKSESRGKIYTFVNAKGGCGSTTLAVNTALTLMHFAERVVLVDLAVPGNATLHLNLTPKYTIRNIYENLHRMDTVLLEQLVTPHASGLHVIAGADEPSDPVLTEQLAAVFDLLVREYDLIVVDVSNWLHETTRRLCEFSDAVFMVAQTDLASIWNAQRLSKFLNRRSSSNNIQLVLNRYKKTPGLSDHELEQASGCKIAWKVPNQFVRVTNAITTGTPVTETDSDLAPAFFSFVESLTGHAPLKPRKHDRNAGTPVKGRLPRLNGLSPLGLKAPDPA